MGKDFRRHVRIRGNNIYIDASYRRTLLDKWVYFKIGTKREVEVLNVSILNGERFDNVDLEYWSSKNR